jgi:branched-chain amino acid transport system ATP-binding protein
MDSVDAALAVVGVSKRFGGVEALTDVSLSVARGEILGLLGANGAGKTTLVDILGGEQSANAGDVLLDGDALSGPPHARARRGLARTFQHPKLAPDLTILENVAVGLAVKALATRRATLRTILSAVVTGHSRFRDPAIAACESVGLHDVDRPASLLSFGEIRLVEVARALIQQPGVLLLDEPFPGLEDDGVVMLAAAIRRAVEPGRSVVLVDHNLSIVAGLVDRVVLLVRGRVAFSGSVEECFASVTFQEEYVGATN